ncbi:type VI secretion system tube protein TssD [Apibacter sp. HY039]|uniref:type VI secretion system tube protein TssD n=1 Tax=Apibacter sp. HY039 TaxID=2501476 RepID=UPI000FEBFEB2|nr:type VI secretion system tube protein TssD [Apibacter sp. HY039]
MSSFLAKIEIDGESYNVLNCRYSFVQGVDSTGKPQATIRGGQIELTVESNGKSNFIDWMLSSEKTKDASIVFYRRDAMSRLQEVKFEKGYCIEFSEEFNSVNSDPMSIKMLIVAKTITIANVAFENSWKIGS